MKTQKLILSLFVIFSLAGVLQAQVTLNPVAARVLGHPQVSLATASPNLVKGEELYSPQGVAIDASVNPPIVYVADTLNNRVLGWRNASQFAHGAPADFVIGQRDMFSTFVQGPGTQLSGGLNSPTGLAVDQNGNLFVADSGNNRILRFPRPAPDAQFVLAPDLVIGQTVLTSRDVNSGGRSARSLFTAVIVQGRLVPTSLVFDAQGNLYVSDPGNGRVLRYPAASVGPGATNGPDANLVLGQVSFTTAPQNPANFTDLSRLVLPAGIALHLSSGRLFVADAGHRVLVYDQPHTTGVPAQRYIGGVVNQQGQPLNPPNEASLRLPEGVFLVGNVPFVIDTANNRVLRYDPYENWPANMPPLAKAVLGQSSFSAGGCAVSLTCPNRGSSQASEKSLFQPVAAALLNGELFLVDSGNHRVLVFPDPSAFNPLDELGATRVLGQPTLDTHDPNSLDGAGFFFGFGSGGGLAVDFRSDPPRLYVADTVNNRVLGFRDARTVRPGLSADLVIGQPELLRSIANWPTGDPLQPAQNSLFQPTGLAVDAEGNLYVADSGNGRVLRFPRPFAQGVNQPAADLVLGKQNFTTPRANAPDPSPSNMGIPYGLAFTGRTSPDDPSDDHLLVSDADFHRVLFFRKPPGGDFTNGMAAEKVFGQPDFFSRASGALDNRMNGPRHIASDTDDRLYVCDSGNRRVEIFGTVTSAGVDPVPVLVLRNLNNPHGIFVSTETGEIFLADTGNARVLRFPRFNVLILNPASDLTLQSSDQPLAVTLDAFGNLLVAYSTHRIAVFYPAMNLINAANFLPTLAPGMISSLFRLDGGMFIDQGLSAPPGTLPKELGDVEVRVNGQAAPLYAVFPRQINFVLPMNLPPGAVDVEVVRKSLGQVLSVGCSAAIAAQNPDGTFRYRCSDLLRVAEVSPAMFAGPGFSAGTGQVAALNRRSSDGSYYGVNDPTNAVSRGDLLEIFGTGGGFIPNSPPDGEPPTGALETPPPKPQVIVGTDFIPESDVLYSGVAPGIPGMWQLNIRIPSSVAPADAVPIVVLHRGVPSNNFNNPSPLNPNFRVRTTIAVKQ